MWAEDEPVVRIATPDIVLLPGPDAPPGAVLSGLQERDPELDAGSVEDLLASDDTAAQTLYADPDAADPLDGRVLMVGRSALSDTDTGLSFQGGEDVEINEDGGHLTEADGFTIAIWRLPPSPTLSCGCDQQGFVAGRGVTRAELLAAAERATVTGPEPSLPGEVVDGLRSLGTTTGAVWPVAIAGPRPQTLTVRLASGHEVDLAVRSGDVRLLPHTRIWAPRGRVVWPGWERRYVVQPGPEGTVVWATAPDAVPEQELEQLIASLVPATDAEVEAALEEIASIPLETCDLEVTSENDTRGDLFGTTADGTRWTVGMMLQDGTLLTCQRLVPRGEVDTGAGSGSGHPSSSFTSPLELLPLGSTGLGDGRRYLTVGGYVDGRAARVVVEVGGLPPVEAELATTGPTGDRRWFALAVEAPTEGPPEIPVSAVAYDNDGAELARDQR